MWQVSFIKFSVLKAEKKKKKHTWLTLNPVFPVQFKSDSCKQKKTKKKKKKKGGNKNTPVTTLPFHW